MLENIASTFKGIAPAVDFWSLRLVHERSESLNVRQGVLQPLHHSVSRGGLLTIIDGDGMGYAATSDLTAQGFKQAIAQAQAFAQLSARTSLFPASKVARPSQNGHYTTPVLRPWEELTLKDKIALLQEANAAL